MSNISNNSGIILEKGDCMFIKFLALLLIFIVLVYLWVREVKKQIHNNIIVRFKKLNSLAIVPTKAHTTDAGFDLTATSIKITDDYIQYGTGIAIELPERCCGLLFPRSSVSKYDLSLCNSVGLVDNAYKGELLLRFNVLKNGDKIYNIGDKIGQLVILELDNYKMEEVSELSETDRGEGGFGSTGK